jgi:glycosyltransferase involved in cell wall biosynthesis
MKLIQICAAYKPAYIYGGPTMSVSKLSEELVKAGHDVTVLTTTANGTEELNVVPNTVQNVDGVAVYYFKRLTKDHTHFSPALFRFLHQLIRDEKRAGRASQLIIHIHAWWNLVSIFAAFIAKWHGIKLVVSPRGMLNEYTVNNSKSLPKRMIHQILGKKLLSYSHIHSTSSNENTDIDNYLHLSSTTIYNFVELPQISRPRSAKNDEVFKIIFLARINPIKKLDQLLTSLARLDINWQLNIAGSGDIAYVDYLKSIVTEHKMEASVFWLGHIPKEQKYQELANADLLVLPSIKENFGNVVIEALSVGTPVVISDGVGAKDIVTQLDLGWVFNENTESLGDCINKAYNDKTKRLRIEQEAPLQIKELFEDNKLISEYLRMYKTLTNQA